ncbi:MAG: hypothetical protein U5K43_04210 [Halofilum sp. (in: g-proteobacteria)]|nr:hypothetical protein [Halofilum sp. (in: g-proteobacteria)]
MADLPTEAFRAFRLREDGDGGELAELHLDDLGAGDVVIRAEYSSVNYKDALAGTGRGKIARTLPLVGGIDAAGTVLHSDAPGLAPGDPVLVTGCGLSEEHDGGYAEYVRVPADWVIPVPPGLDTYQAMALGTAGFTAALALQRLEENGLEPGLGPVAVTGATGGVGSIALDLLAARGYEAVAVTGKADATDYLDGDRRQPRDRPRRARRPGAGPGEGPLGRRHRQRRRRPAGRHPAHHRALGQRRQHRPRGRHRARRHGHAVHPARRQPARHHLGELPALAPRACLGAARR